MGNVEVFSTMGYSNNKRYGTHDIPHGTTPPPHGTAQTFNIQGVVY